MNDNWQNWPGTKLLVLSAGAIAALYLLRLVFQALAVFGDTFLIIFLAWILAFTLEPLVERLNKKRVGRTKAAIIVYLFLVVGFGGFILFIIPEIVSQLNGLTVILPRYFSGIPSWANRLEGVIMSAIGGSVFLVSSVAQFLFLFSLVLIISFYFLVDREKIWGEMSGFIPDRYRKEADFLRITINTIFASFVRIQFLLGLITGVATWFLMKLVGLDFAVSAAIAAGFLAIIPIAGPIVSLFPPVLAGFLASTNQGVVIFGLLLLFQQIELNVLVPKLMGAALKIHPVVILLSFLVGAKIAGIWGAFFAAPFIAVAVVIVREILTHYRQQTPVLSN